MTDNKNKTANKGNQVSRKSIGIISVAVALVAVMITVVVISANCSNNGKKTVTDPTANQIIEQITSPTNDPETEEYEINTSVLNFYFPKKWQSVVTVADNVEDGTGTVDLYADIGNHGKELLFSIAINTDGDVPVGILTDQGNSLYISLNIPEPEFDSSWSSEEKELYSYIREDVNYIINYLNSLSNFVTNA